jgi:hypothetical protein
MMALPARATGTGDVPRVASMPDYRVYKIKNNHIADAPVVVTCDSDREAIQQAKKLVDGHDVELWDGPRFVIGIKSGDDT